ncbi:hypothetical protein BCR36DRAFT_415350 [Piromyces finnis]|uniref:Uncharacterized protein n=1 Tax=Piromyces finnis TaxID=1754191 RepID=A0A1Y1UZ50_9FUNG|nr:hypothetical protein BCR36DRAFT_415350 [Piromyces finnis]|eukprot:ORX43751.1 hypothetical protein BCR36DRAFT_415350 [Piromyces finnis]
MTDIEYSSGPDKVPLHFYISQNSTTHNNYNRIYEREKPKCPCRKYYNGDDCIHCKKSNNNDENNQSYIRSLLKFAPKEESKTGFSNNKNPFVVYDKSIDENDDFRDDYHWLTTYNEKFKTPKYKDKGNNIYTIVDDGYTRGINKLFDPSLHTKDDNISVTKKDYTEKINNRDIQQKDNIIEMNSGYGKNACKLHTYNDLADYVNDDYNDMDKDKKIDWFYNRNIFPTYIEDDGYTRTGIIKRYMDFAPKFEEDNKKKKNINFPTLNNKKSFEQFKTVTQSDYTFKPTNVYDKLKINVDKSSSDDNKLYSGLPYIPIKNDPDDYISETMDKYRDNKESKKVEEQLKKPFICDYMFDDGYTKGNKNCNGLISNKYYENETKLNDDPSSLFSSSRLYCKRQFGISSLNHLSSNTKLDEIDNFPTNPQNCKPDTSLIEYLQKTKKKINT